MQINGRTSHINEKPVSSFEIILCKCLLSYITWVLRPTLKLTDHAVFFLSADHQLLVNQSAN